MQTEKCYSYLIIVKLLTLFRSMKHSRDSLELQFVVYKAVTATFLHSMYFCWNSAIIWHIHSIYTVLWLPCFNNISHTLVSKQRCLLLAYYYSSLGVWFLNDLWEILSCCEFFKHIFYSILRNYGEVCNMLMLYSSVLYRYFMKSLEIEIIYSSKISWNWVKFVFQEFTES